MISARTPCGELKKIKLAWPELNYATAKGVLILYPSKPSIAPTTGPQVSLSSSRTVQQASEGEPDTFPPPDAPTPLRGAEGRLWGYPQIAVDSGSFPRANTPTRTGNLRANTPTRTGNLRAKPRHSSS